MIKNENLCYEVSDSRLENIYSTQNFIGNKIICSLKWINTRNKFSRHILKSLLHYQRKYWFSGREVDIKPLTLSKFLSIYPLQYLEKTRLSRLIQNLSVMNPQNQIVCLRSLFISSRKYYSYLIREIVPIHPLPRFHRDYGERVYRDEKALRDKDIQYLLAQKGVHLSVRTICNCRKLLNIPNYREKASYYEKDIAFSDYILLSKRYFSRIPTESGVYELSITSKIEYPFYRTNIIYIGSSKNLRRRIVNYSGNKLKNNRLNEFTNNYDIFVRFCLTGNRILLERKFLKNFKKIFGELPKANRLGG